MRVLTALQDALEVLSMESELRESELRREFLSYWSQRASSGRARYLSIVEPVVGSRDIVWHVNKKGHFLFAEDATALGTWASRTGGEAPKSPSTTRLVWLDQPLTPEEFPKVGNDIMELAGRGSIDPHVRPGQRLPVLIGCNIGGTAVFAAAELDGISAKQAQKGFRPSHPRPQSLMADGFRMKEVLRREVKRADFAAVHGRSRNPDIEKLRESKVAVIGCGAIGGFMAHALAQAGVGMLFLVDGDELSPSNVGRHLLGMEWATSTKATATASQLKSDFPHMRDAIAYPTRFESLKDQELRELAGCQLVVLAGVDPIAELRVARWRQLIETPPAIVWTWIEEFAVAGHAVGIIDDACITDSLDADGAFQMRLTSEWPKGVAHATEAGCGVAYQPYSAVDMMGTINIANRLAIDVLLGRTSETVVRSWLGDRAIAEARECRISDEFDRSFSEISRGWRW